MFSERREERNQRPGGEGFNYRTTKANRKVLEAHCICRTEKYKQTKQKKYQLT